MVQLKNNVQDLRCFKNILNSDHTWLEKKINTLILGSVRGRNGAYITN